MDSPAVEALEEPLGTTDEVASTYDALADQWERRSASGGPDLRSSWARKLERFARAGERIIELGCGTGVPVGWMLSSRYDYVGVDASAEMLNRARNAMPTTTLLHTDMADVQFTPRSVGAVIAFSSIPHVPRDQHATLFSSIAAWLRPQGVFIGNLLSDDQPDRYEPNWLNAGPMRWSGFDAVTNLGLLRQAGFDVLDTSIVDHRGPHDSTTPQLWFVAKRVTAN